MPYLHITLSTPASTNTAHQVAKLLTDLTASILRKKRELTAVRVEFADPQFWTIGGIALVGQPQNSFYLDAKVTDGTNTPEEKARYIAQVFSGLELLLGPLAAASYTVVHEVPAQSWGYQGRTQAARSAAVAMAMA
jgi:4-oxalocrotonate tautomerase